MLSKRLNKSWLLTLGAFTALSIALLSCPITSIQISSDDFKCLLKQPTLTLQWIHSVEKELWQETYQITDQQLLLTSTQFKTFGAGTPSSSSTGAIASNDGWLHYQIDRLLPRIHWVVSRNIQSTILIEHGTWPLYQNAADYAEIQIQVIQIPSWQYFTQDTCNGYFRKK